MLNPCCCLPVTKRHDTPCLSWGFSVSTCPTTEECHRRVICHCCSVILCVSLSFMCPGEKTCSPRSYEPSYRLLNAVIWHYFLYELRAGEKFVLCYDYSVCVGVSERQSKNNLFTVQLKSSVLTCCRFLCAEKPCSRCSFHSFSLCRK